MSAQLNSIIKPSSKTKRFADLHSSDLNHDEFIITPKIVNEQRGKIKLWNDLKKTNPRALIHVNEISRDTINITIGEDAGEKISLRDEDRLGSLFNGKKVLIDISTLPQHVWAPILKALYKYKTPTRILYVEPKSYNLHESPASNTLFDLSSRFEGLAPLPGFAKLSGPDNENECLFIAMLGFEGNRPLRLLNDIDPPPKVIPIVGVPGFQIEFPTYTVTCNQRLLEDFNAHSEIRFSKASCPFQVYEELARIHNDFPEYYMYLAPVGTKPHALGLILYSIVNPGYTEIMFDHPVKKEGRTKGMGIIHIYDFGVFDDY